MKIRSLAAKNKKERLACSQEQKKAALLLGVEITFLMGVEIGFVMKIDFYP
jgi:hypothetical protein